MNRIRVRRDLLACPPDQVYRDDIMDGFDWDQMLVLDFARSNAEEFSILWALRKCINARFLIVDQTKIGPSGLLRILQVWREKERLNFISALDDRYDWDQSMVDELIKWEDRLAEELKKNVNIYSLDLINDEGKQNSILPKIKLELSK